MFAAIESKKSNDQIALGSLREEAQDSFVRASLLLLSLSLVGWDTLGCGRQPLTDGETSAVGASAMGTMGTGGATTTTSAGGALFDVCVNGSGCSTGYKCFCGICTRACAGPAQCTGLGAGATCPTSLPSTSACVDPVTVCVVECSTDGDCGALGPTAVCSAGSCRRPLLVSSVGRSVLSCEDRNAATKARLDPVVASADRACTTDTDCVRAPLGNSCYGDGCSGAVVSKVGAAAIAAELEALQNADCEAAFKAGCVGAGRTRCPSIVFARCVAGQCK
jgi:hypothetical protein